MKFTQLFKKKEVEGYYNMAIDFNKPRKVRKSPNRLFIYATYKVGKTSMITGLNDYLCIDFEDGSSHYEGNFISIQALAEEHKLTLLEVLNELFQKLETDGKIYKYLILDTATSMEDVAKEYAGLLYKQTPLGSNWKGGDILALPHGAGYGYLRNAFERIYNRFEKYCDRLILLGHVKNSSITKDGKEVAARDVNLTGGLKHVVCAHADAIAYLYRKDKNTNVLSFVKEGETDLATGTRCDHLADKEIVISEKIDGNIVTHWDKVYID
jgi:hypothetical protein